MIIDIFGIEDIIRKNKEKIAQYIREQLQEDIAYINPFGEKLTKGHQLFKQLNEELRGWQKFSKA